MNKLLLILGVLLLVQCIPDKITVSKPDHFLKKSAFAELMYDINLLEGNLSNINLDTKLMADTALGMYAGVFEKHGITYSIFQANQEYYILANKMKGIAETVLERVEKEAEQYKDLEAIRPVSFVQLNQLLTQEGMVDYMTNDTSSTYPERLDSVLRYFRTKPEKLAEFTIDSTSFEVAILKLKKGKDVYREQSIFFNKQ